MKTRRKAIINLIFLVATLGVNTLGFLGLINGYDQKEVSDMYQTLITPSPGTFSIWSLIYTLIIISLIMMILKKEDTYYKSATENISTLFRLSCIFNGLWIVAFSYLQLEISNLFIFGMLISISLILQNLKEISNDRAVLPITFGIYNGWVFIATVVNVSATLVKLQWNRFGLSESFWASVVLIGAVIMVFLVNLRNKNSFFPLPIAWAYFGIFTFLRSAEGFNGQYPNLEHISAGGAAILLFLAAIRLYKNNFKVMKSWYYLY